MQDPLDLSNGPIRPFLPFVIHPQSGTVCYVDRPYPWPDEGFLSPAPIGYHEDVTLWPVPRIKEARLVDCRGCNRAGIQPQTFEAAVRYIPGTKLTWKNGEPTLTMDFASPSIAYPTGSGEDEDIGH